MHPSLCRMGHEPWGRGGTAPVKAPSLAPCYEPLLRVVSLSAGERQHEQGDPSPAFLSKAGGGGRKGDRLSPKPRGLDRSCSPTAGARGMVLSRRMKRSPQDIQLHFRFQIAHSSRTVPEVRGASRSAIAAQCTVEASPGNTVLGIGLLKSWIVGFSAIDCDGALCLLPDCQLDVNANTRVDPFL